MGVQALFFLCIVLSVSLNVCHCLITSRTIRHVTLKSSPAITTRTASIGSFALSAKPLVAEVVAPTKKNLAFLGSFARLASCIAIRINPTILGGFLAGGLHAITGPDHLAALIPSSIGLNGLHGLRIGAFWGFGHGISAMVLGMGMFSLKDSLGGKLDVIKNLSNLAESIVGVSLVFIGLMGIKENMDIMKEKNSCPPKGAVAGVLEGIGLEADEKDCVIENVDVTDNVVYSPATNEVFGGTSLAIFANGLLHGCSLDGAPSILPAIAMNSWESALTFLSAYCFGTIFTMSFTAGIVGELSIRIGKAMNNPNLPRNLSMGSSGLAIIIGLYWIVKGFI